MIWYETVQLTGDGGQIAAEVQQDLEQLKPDVILDTMKSWLPGLITLGYRLLAAGIILIIGFRIARIIQKMMGKTFGRMDMEVSLRKFLLSAVYACICRGGETGDQFRLDYRPSGFCRPGPQLVPPEHAGKFCRGSGAAPPEAF
jgi:hypothetical protein